MNIKKTTIQNFFKLIAGVLILAVIALLLFGDNKKQADLVETSNTSGDIQVIEITAKGGYSPKIIEAKADLESVLRVKTENTFDCSLSLSIPKLGVNKNLPTNGVSEFEIKPQESGSTIDGTCAMGMYGFKIKFE